MGGARSRAREGRIPARAARAWSIPSNIFIFENYNATINSSRAVVAVAAAAAATAAAAAAGCGSGCGCGCGCGCGIAPSPVARCAPVARRPSTVARCPPPAPSSRSASPPPHRAACLRHAPRARCGWGRGGVLAVWCRGGPPQSGRWSRCALPCHALPCHAFAALVVSVRLALPCPALPLPRSWSRRAPPCPAIVVSVLVLVLKLVPPRTGPPPAPARWPFGSPRALALRQPPRDGPRCVAASPPPPPRALPVLATRARSGCQRTLPVLAAARCTRARARARASRASCAAVRCSAPCRYVNTLIVILS